MKRQVKAKMNVSETVSKNPEAIMQDDVVVNSERKIAFEDKCIQNNDSTLSCK